MYHSFKEFSRHLTALGCLFLAGKTEETPKKCRDIVQLAKEKLSDKHWYQAFGKGDKDPKEEVMSVERVLLQTIKFDLQVQHPYTFLLKYAKLLKIDKEKARNMVQMAWTFVNDSLCTTLCLQWEPEIIAIALMYLASRLSKVEITDWHGKKGERGEKWWDQVVENMSMNLLEDICHQVLDLYSASTGKASGAGSASSSVAPTTSSPSGVPTSTPSSSTSSNKLSPYNPTNPATPSPARLPLGPGLTPVQTSGPPVLGSLTPMPPGALPPSRTPLHPQPPSSGGTLPVPSPQYPVPPGGYPTPQGGGFPYPPPRGYLPPPGQSRGTPVGPTPPPIHGSSYQQGFQHQNSYPRGY